MRTLHIAIIGTGWFGQFHLATCLKEKDVKVVAVVSTNSQKLTQVMAAHPGLHGYQNAEEMFENEPDLDALIVAVPPDRHNGIEKQAAKRNLALFLEKPLGVDLSTVLENDKVIKEAGIINSVGYHTRYNPSIDTLKEYLKTHHPCSLSIRWIDSMPPTPWWRDKARSGGQIIEQATHLIDIVRYLVGEIEESAGFAREDLNGEVADFKTDSASVSALRFSDGTIGTLECGCCKSSEAEKDISLTIHTKDKICRYNWNNTLFIGDTEIEGLIGTEIYQRELRAFFDAVLTHDQSKIRCSYQEAVKTFKTTLAIEKALRENSKVKIELD